MKKVQRLMPAAFTLVELLVVISIIALLLSIMMPALQKAKNLAKDVVCKKNSGSMGVIFETFANGNDDRYPDHYNMWPSTLRDWMSEKLLDRSKKIFGSDLTVQLKSYVGDPAIFYCPLAKDMNRGGYSTASSPDWFDADTGYTGWNGGPDGTAAYRSASYSLWSGYVPSSTSGLGEVKYFNGEKPVRRSLDVTSRVAISGDVFSLNYVNAGVSGDEEAKNWELKKTDFEASTREDPYVFTNHKWDIGGINVLYGDYHVEKRTWSKIKGKAKVVSGPALMYYW